MKSSILMTIIGFFIAFTNISFANSNNSAPECCRKQETCCVKDAKCCQSENDSQKSSDCCVKKGSCCEKNADCCASGKVNHKNANDFLARENSDKNLTCENHKSSCCK